MIYNFLPFAPVLFAHEGGYANDPRDPGGETNFGISKRSYPAENIRAMTKERAQSIYKRDYWDKIKGDQLPSGVDVVVFDAAVNSGVSRASKWLQEIVGVKQDGVIGPDTIKAVMARDPLVVIDRYSDRRLAFMKSAKDKSGKLLWPTYGRGWERRVVAVENHAKTVMEKGVVSASPKPSRSLLSIILELIKGVFRK